MMLREIDYDLLDSEGVQLLAAGRAMFHVAQPIAFGRTAQLGMGGGQAAADRTQAGMPLADVVEEGGPDQVVSYRLEACHMPGRVQTVPLVVAGLGEKGIGLGRREPSPDFVDFVRRQTGREHDRQETNREMTPGPRGGDRPRTQERFTVQSTQ